MQQYSSDVDGKLTPWHMAFLGGMIIRGPGLTIVEATAVTPEGRITPNDLGLWSDDQIESHKELVTFAHSQGAKIGVQIGHSGRKGSTVSPWLSFGSTASKVAGGWFDSIVGPSAVPFSEASFAPKEMTVQDIEEHVAAFANAARRAIQIGYDVINIHGGHGYLLSQFLSPHANKRTDAYGGSYENRIRFLVEVVDAVRATIPETVPLFVRVSATDCLEQTNVSASWTVEQTVQLSHVLRNHGVDLMDISSGGQSPAQVLNILGSQSQYSKVVKNDIKDTILVGCVGGITDGRTAESYLQERRGDVCFVGRNFLKNADTVLSFARELDVEVTMAKQLGWCFAGRGTRT